MPIVFASVLIGSAVGLFAWWFARAIFETDGQDDEWRYDRVRIAELRRLDALYRWLYPLFVPLARINRNAFRGSLKEIQREIQAAGLPRFGFTLFTKRLIRRYSYYALGKIDSIIFHVLDGQPNWHATGIFSI